MLREEQDAETYVHQTGHVDCISQEPPPGPSLVQISLRGTDRERKWEMCNGTSPQTALRTATTLPHPSDTQKDAEAEETRGCRPWHRPSTKDPARQLGIGRKHWITWVLATWGNVPKHKCFRN